MPKAKPYWEQETPTEAKTARVWATWFPQAGRLQLAVLWRDEDGAPQRGRTVTLAVEDWASHPEAVAVLEAFLHHVRQAVAQEGRTDV
jgi:hypothetical protein